MSVSRAAIAATKGADPERQRDRKPVVKPGFYQPDTAAGTVGVIAGEAARFTAFGMALSALQMPNNSRLKWVVSGDRINGTNTLVREFLGDWLWIMGDDHAFHPEILNRLLSHDADIVCPLVLSRRTPFNPYSFTSTDPMIPLDLHGCPPHGLVEVEAAGSAGMLVQRHVFEALSDPWFEYDPEGEDIAFCNKARQAGFRIFVDLDAHLGHIASAVLWPTQVDGQWATGITVADGMSVCVEQPRTI